jgi:hypothetical protein
VISYTLSSLLYSPFLFNPLRAAPSYSRSSSSLPDSFLFVRTGFLLHYDLCGD